MNYQKDYNKNKAKILNSFHDLIKKGGRPISELGFEFLEFDFVDARSQDDYIEFIWRTESKKLSVCFWIPFWKNYKIDENFMVTISLTDDMNKKNPLVSKDIKFKKLYGKDIEAKINTLFKYIVEIINSRQQI